MAGIDAVAVRVDITRALAIPDLRWPFEDELRWLAEQATTRQRIVEVGSYLGRSTVAMAANTSGTVYTHDDWYGPRDSDIHDEDRPRFYEEFCRNVEGLRVVPIRCDHADPPLPSLIDLDMVFIDGSHEYDDVCRDIRTWKARLAPGGLLCGHDRDEPGVRAALDTTLPGWQPVPGDTILWQWTEDSKMAIGLRKMDIDELKLLGTPNAFPVAATPPTVPKLAAEVMKWEHSGPEPTSKVGLAVMIPSVTRNGDGSMRVIPVEWGMGLALLAPLANCRHAVLSVKDVERGAARTALVKKARSYGAKWGFFLDDDTVPPPDALQKLQYVLENADDDVAVAAGIYTTKSDPPVPLVFQDYGIGPYWKWRKGDVFECQSIATGCMMIRLSVFDSLPEPWFVDVHGVEHAKLLGLYAPGQSIPLASEWTDDMFFCWRLRQHGWRMMAHGGVLCEHWSQDGRCYQLPSDSYPMRPR